MIYVEVRISKRDFHSRMREVVELVYLSRIELQVSASAPEVQLSLGPFGRHHIDEQLEAAPTEETRRHAEHPERLLEGMVKRLLHEECSVDVLAIRLRFNGWSLV